MTVGLLTHNQTEARKKDSWELRSQQKYTKFMHDYAMSLEGNIHTEPIVVKRTSSASAHGEVEAKGKKPKVRGKKVGGKEKVRLMFVMTWFCQNSYFRPGSSPYNGVAQPVKQHLNPT